MIKSEAYYESLAQELHAMKSRARDLIGSVHWPSDGAWKESIFKSVLRRHLPPNIGMGSGFVVDSGWTSNQLDVIVYDNRHPVLFRDGDFVVVAPQSVKGIIEVKTTLRGQDLSGILEKLADNSGHIGGGGPDTKFVGLFAFDVDPALTHAKLLTSLAQAAAVHEHAITSHVCAGASIFAKYYAQDSNQGGASACWKSFDLASSAPGYFLAGVLRGVVGRIDLSYEFTWFEHEPDHAQCRAEQPFPNID